MTADKGKNKKKSLKEIAYEKIKSDIIENRLRPGALIGEVMLSKQMHMSRTPIRQALQMLESQRLVEIRDGAGTFVTKFTARDIQDAYEIRRTMEVLAVRTAIYEITDEELDRLEEQFLELQESLKDGIGPPFSDFAAVDWDLHDTITLRSKNQSIQIATEAISNLLRRYQYVSVKQYGQAAESVDEHLAIIAALRSRDLDLAIKRLEEHIHF